MAGTGEVKVGGRRGAEFGNREQGAGKADGRGRKRGAEVDGGGISEQSAVAAVGWKKRGVVVVGCGSRKHFAWAAGGWGRNQVVRTGGSRGERQKVGAGSS